MDTLNVAILVLGLSMLIFRRPIGNVAWQCKHPDDDETKPPMKDSYVHMVGGIGFTFIVFSIAMHFT